MDCMYEWFYKKIGGRVFIDLDPIANAYYEIASPITFSGDFEIEINFETTDTGTDNILLGKTGDGRGFVRLQNGTPSINFSQAAVAFTFGSNTFYDGELHTLKIENTSGTIKLFIDGVLQGTTTPADISNTNFDAIGHKSGQFFDGIIANAKLTDKSGASDVVTTFRLDELTANTEYSQENVFGSELVANGNFATDADWDAVISATVTATNNTLEVTTTSQASGAYQNISTNAGAVYTFTATASSFVSGALIRVTDGAAPAAGFAESQVVDGTAVLTFTAVGSITNVYLRNTVAGTSVWTSASVKEITNAVTYQNIAQTSDVRDTYTLIEGDWVGSEEVTNGNFATDSDWALFNGATISNNRANIIGDGSSFTSVSQASVFQGDKQYSVNLDVVINSGLGIKIQSAGNEDIGFATTTGNYTFTFNQLGGTSLIIGRRTGGTPFSSSIDNVSVKRLIEVAS